MRHLHVSVRTTVASLALCAALLEGGIARADCTPAKLESNDLALECIIDRSDGSAVPDLREQSYYRSLVSQLAAVMAVPMLEPADTVGFSGFHFSFDVNATTVDQSAPYIAGLQPSGLTKAGFRKLSGPMLPVGSIMLRKGVWMPIPPLPSVELGFGASNLFNSGIYAINGYLKLAIHEGYHDVWVPSIALRASVTRLAGAAQIDLTMINADGVISKAFGAGGTFTIEPYLGGGVIFAIARSQVIDTNPTIDLYRGPMGVTFGDNERQAALADKIVYPTQSDIMRWRVFLGLHIHYAILALTAGFTVIGPGQNAGTDIEAFKGIPGGTPADVSPTQYQVNTSLGLRF